MKNGPLFLAGLFGALTISWAGTVLFTNSQIGRLTPYYDDAEGSSFPLRPSGIAAQGEQVYVDLGCASCHTQQVRRPGYGSDQARGWGERQSVARDYIFESRPQLGSLRYGPDLANFGARKPPPDELELLKFLYAGSASHPGYRYLFQTREVVGERSSRALTLADTLAPRAGYEVVPTSRAEALVSYLSSRRQSYEFPEARPAVTAPETKPATSGPVNTEPSPATEKSNPSGKRPEQAVPAAAPDENKKPTK